MCVMKLWVYLYQILGAHFSADNTDIYFNWTAMNSEVA